MAPSVKDLRELSRDALIRRHDQGVEHVQVGVTYNLEELHRRDLKEQGDRMLTLSEDMHRLTKINVLVAAGALVAAIIAIFAG